LENEQKNIKYDLIANICHEGTPDDGFYKIHLRNKYKKEWYEI
jgi:U4/U6.U5 tri-snRNP-associated protein 2